MYICVLKQPHHATHTSHHRFHIRDSITPRIGFRPGNLQGTHTVTQVRSHHHGSEERESRHLRSQIHLPNALAAHEAQATGGGGEGGGNDNHLKNKSMSKAIRTVFKNDTLSLHECTDGYWLYDYVIGWNIVARAKTEQEAFIEALMYYQEKLKQTKTELEALSNKVDNFISQFDKGEDDE